MAGQIQPFQQKYKTMREALEKRNAEFQAAIPKGMALDSARFLRTALTTFQLKPELLDCTPASVTVALLQAAAFGLELDPVLGQAYLVPYGQVCQLIIGYKGYMVLARRSNLITSIDARAVRQRDEFNFELGLDRKLVHRPYWGPEEPGEIIGAYVIARFTNGDHAIYAMHRREIDAIRSRSRAKSGPWQTDFEPMAVKTVIRQAQKFWPIYIEDLARAAELDDQVDSGRDQILTSIAPGIDLLPEAGADIKEQPQKSRLDQFTEQQQGAGQDAQGAPQGGAEESSQGKTPEKPAAAVDAGKQAAEAPATQPPADAKKATPKPQGVKTSVPQSPEPRELSRGEQASRHEVPRAHRARVQPGAEPEQPGLMSEDEARQLDRELAEQDARHETQGREPGSDDE